MAIDIYQVLRKQFPEKEYVLLAEVSDKAGHSRSRSADYIVMSLWPSRGLSLQGIELKSSRGDWLAELKKPEKAENIFQFCDYFWLLTADENIAKLEEIPETWGWMSVKKDRIIHLKKAPKLSPKPITNHFLAALLKRASEKDGWIRVAEIEDRLKQVRDSEKINCDDRIKSTIEQLNNLIRVVEAFEKESGIKLPRSIHEWRGVERARKMGEAVRLIENGGANQIRQQLTQLEQTAKNILSSITNGLKALSESELQKNGE